jgi:hypothetical protein
LHAFVLEVDGGPRLDSKVIERLVVKLEDNPLVIELLSLGADHIVTY